ncbi:MAG: hypothetical protein ACJA1L_000153, partial [Paracoccaceae bacterium]
MGGHNHPFAPRIPAGPDLIGLYGAFFGEGPGRTGMDRSDRRAQAS